jgi:hypothetical protein
MDQAIPWAREEQSRKQMQSIVFPIVPIIPKKGADVYIPPVGISEASGGLRMAHAPCGLGFQVGPRRLLVDLKVCPMLPVMCLLGHNASKQ